MINRLVILNNHVFRYDFLEVNFLFLFEFVLFVYVFFFI